MDDAVKSKEENNLHRVCFVSSITLAVVTVITFVIAFNTEPISGPLAQGMVVQYPYTDIISRFPQDYYWMYPAMLLMLVFVIYMVGIDRFAPANRIVFSRIALALACLAAGIIFIDYFIQVTVIQPSLIKGEFESIAILSQYNPHGIFIALEEAGYLIMSISILFLAPVFVSFGRIGKKMRLIAALGFILTIVSLIAISAIYGIEREYIFEITVIAIDYLVLTLLGILSAVFFRNAGKGNKLAGI